MFFNFFLLRKEYLRIYGCLVSVKYLDYVRILYYILSIFVKDKYEVNSYLKFRENFEIEIEDYFY